MRPFTQPAESSPMRRGLKVAGGLGMSAHLVPAESSPMRRGLKGQHRRGLPLRHDRRIFPDEEGTESRVKRHPGERAGGARRIFPDEEGTERYEGSA